MVVGTAWLLTLMVLLGTLGAPGYGKLIVAAVAVGLIVASVKLTKWASRHQSSTNSP
jgi:hypothetical protein